MKEIDWSAEVEKRRDDLIRDAQRLLQIKSILDEETAGPEAPLGKGVKEALDYMLELGKRGGFSTKNTGNLAGHLEFGGGKELLGILCHVDVVPAGEGWKSDPYSGDIRDGKIYARGALDDKGPTMAAYYAMKIVKELGLPLQKRVRMIIGTDEESEWRCVNHYFKHEEMPTLGFAPDADFPIINAEKGIADFDIVQKNAAPGSAGDCRILYFRSGERYNMVPDKAQAGLDVKDGQTPVIQSFIRFAEDHELEYNCHVDNGVLVLELKGVSAHAMEPDNGKSAGLHLAKFLSTVETDARSKDYFLFVSRYFFNDSRGNSLGIAYSDDISGDTTFNAGILQFTQESGGRLGLSCRYSVTNNMEETKEKLHKQLAAEGYGIENFSDSKPHFVDENEFLIQTLRKVYEAQTGDKAELLAIGGGTYARSLQSGVAFGPLFPGRPDTAHQKDEYMFIDDLLKATAIYAQAIYELAKD